MQKPEGRRMRTVFEEADKLSFIEDAVMYGAGACGAT